jgi:hypothetical protein
MDFPRTTKKHVRAVHVNSEEAFGVSPGTPELTP